jgi:hypothetical protein
MSTDDILDAIDHALQDFGVSGDAMRWSPEEPPKDATGHAWPAGWADIGYTMEDPPEWARAREDAGSRYRAALAADPELREEPRLHMTPDDVARLFDVPAHVIRRTFGACACPEDGHVPTCVMRAVERRGAPLVGPTHRDAPSLAEHADNALARRQGRDAERMEGQRATLSILDEIQRFMDIADAFNHDLRRTHITCEGCKALRERASRLTLLSVPDGHGHGTEALYNRLLDTHTRWGREHAYANDMMARARIPVFSPTADPLPYYRALWNNARGRRLVDVIGLEHGHRDPSVPFVHFSRPDRGEKAVLFLGGQSPWDGSIVSMSADSNHHAINVSASVPGAFMPGGLMSPIGPPLPIDTYQAMSYRFRHRMHGELQDWTEVVYLSGITRERAQPIVHEALVRGYIGPLAVVRREG